LTLTAGPTSALFYPLPQEEKRSAAGKRTKTVSIDSFTDTK